MNNKSITDEISKLNDLKEKSAITEEEFEKLKSNLLKSEESENIGKIENEELKKKTTDLDDKFIPNKTKDKKEKKITAKLAIQIVAILFILSFLPNFCNSDNSKDDKKETETKKKEVVVTKNSREETPEEKNGKKEEKSELTAEKSKKLKEFQEKLESNKIIYYDSYDKMIANIESQNESQLHKNVSDALKNFKKADTEIIALSKQYVNTEKNGDIKSALSEMWWSYQDTMGTKYSVVEAVDKYLKTNDDRDLEVLKDLVQMAKNSEMEHLTKDLPKFEKEIGK